MKAMDKAFTRVDETFEAIRDSLNQQAINNIARKLAQDLRRAQQARIRSQKAPDGTAWTPRRRSAYPSWPRSQQNSYPTLSHFCKTTLVLPAELSLEFS